MSGEPVQPNRSGKILFVSHDAARSGGALLLLDFLRWLRENTEIEFGILLRTGGPLRSDFEKLGPVMMFRMGPMFRSVRAQSWATRVGLHGAVARIHGALLRRRVARAHVSLTYSNTCTNHEVLEWLSFLGRPIICHVHELQIAIKQYAGERSFRSYNGRLPHIIAASQAVRHNLICHHGIAPGRIDVVNSFIRAKQPDTADDGRTREELRRELDVPDQALIVGACGSPNWWKGPDLFVQLARAVVESDSDLPIHFVWIGGDTSGETYDQIMHDVCKAGLGERVRFIGSRPNAREYFPLFDVFALTSREEAASRVVLEAAACEKPVVCFDQVGGPQEFIENDCGFVVPYLDIRGMAEKVCVLLRSPDLRREMGRRGRAKVLERHDISVAAPKIVRIIEKVCAEAG